MTYEEAIKHLNFNEIYTNDWVEAVSMAKEAIEKQIPKKPMRDTKQWATCPACGGCVSKSNIWEHIVEKEATFCEHCGQALEWGDAE